jgi:hypothetical protein
LNVAPDGLDEAIANHHRCVIQGYAGFGNDLAAHQSMHARRLGPKTRWEQFRNGPI